MISHEGNDLLVGEEMRYLSLFPLLMFCDPLFHILHFSQMDRGPPSVISYTASETETNGRWNQLFNKPR